MSARNYFRSRRPCPICGRAACWHRHKTSPNQYRRAESSAELPEAAAPRKVYNPDWLRKDIWDADMAKDD
jgi:hypothetical protein